MVAFGCFCLALVGFGFLVVFGWGWLVWLILFGFGWFCLILVGCRQKLCDPQPIVSQSVCKVGIELLGQLKINESAVF